MMNWLESLATWIVFVLAVAIGVAVGNLLTLVTITRIIKVISP